MFYYFDGKSRNYRDYMGSAPLLRAELDTDSYKDPAVYGEYPKLTS